MTEAFSQFAAEYDAALAELSDEQRRLLETHRQVLDQTRELPTLEQKMEEERGRLEGLLGTLAELCGDVARALDSQTRFEENARRRIGRAVGGLRRALAGGSTCEARGVRRDWQWKSRRCQCLWRAEPTIRGGGRHHARLAKAYESTRRDLVEGFPLLLSSVAFGDYLAAFEGDDLSIFFNVGQGDEDYRAIDQLSAGQRCTAIFPCC